MPGAAEQHSPGDARPQRHSELVLPDGVVNQPPQILFTHDGSAAGCAGRVAVAAVMICDSRNSIGVPCVGIRNSDQPVLPKPPAPRSVSLRSSASSRITSGSRMMTAWAMRSPGLISYSLLGSPGPGGSMVSATLISPR